ncbi:MAG: hypothetical protein MUC78_11365 [Bacteroidales bacterium]|jgi:hypothetical protein|nr:hypothetical protein [Bacteroidales bacterium]
MNYKAYLISASLIIGSITVSGQQVTDSKTFRKSFRAEGDVIVDITNKYGNINISHTKSDSVIIRVEVEASSDSESKLKGMISDIDISITKSEERIIARTDVGNSVNTFLESFKGLTRSFIKYETRLQVNYFIECPPKTALRIENSYGDVYIPDHTTELTLTLANGSLYAGIIDNVKQMTLTFCKAEIKNVVDGRIVLNYGEMRCDSAGNLSLVGRASKARLGWAGSIDLDSKRDDIIIEEAEILRGSSYFSDIKVSALGKEAGLVTKYGNVSVNSLAAGFSLIDLNTSYTDVEFYIEAKSSYDLEIRHTNAFVSLPGINPEPVRTTVNAESKIYLTSGKYGSSPENSRIRIEATRGEIRIVQK